MRHGAFVARQMAVRLTGVAARRQGAVLRCRTVTFGTVLDPSCQACDAETEDHVEPVVHVVLDVLREGGRAEQLDQAQVETLRAARSFSQATSTAGDESRVKIRVAAGGGELFQDETVRQARGSFEGLGDSLEPVDIKVPRTVDPGQPWGVQRAHRVAAPRVDASEVSRTADRRAAASAMRSTTTGCHRAA